MADLNDSDVENQAPINHIDDYMEDYMMDKDKEFDDKLLDEDYISRSDAYKMLSLRVLRNTRQILLVNFIRCEARRGLTLFV